jgi:hypothetical protein
VKGRGASARLRTAAAVAGLLALGGCAGGLPPADPGYPRYTAEQLRADGYPDPHHVYARPDWTPRRDAAGKEFGFRTVCRGPVWLDRPDAVKGEGRLTLGPFTVSFDPEYDPCQIAPLLEHCEAAVADVGALLGLAPGDSLLILDPDNLDEYLRLTGQGPWRMMSYRGGACTVQPVPVLIARTLLPHAAYELVARWLLEVNGCGGLPPWLREGVAVYAADFGVHLNNFMAQYRPDGPVLFGPGDADALIGAAPLPDPETDRQMHRRAGYTAFVMVWRLVEEHGGPTRLRALLADVRDGVSPDAACRAAYGLDLAALAAQLDASRGPEPIGDAVQSRNPQQPAAVSGGAAPEKRTDDE